MSKFAFRALLFLAGLACVACEVWGSFDYMIEKYGRWNYLVAGSLVVTSLGALLPLAAEYARREGARFWPWIAWACVPLALIFVFTVAVQRTGQVVDTDEAGRQGIAQAIKIAQDEEREAIAQLVIDKALVKQACADGVIGRSCKPAMAAQEKTETKLAGARAVLKKQGVVTDDSLAKRIVAFLPFLTKEEVQLYLPMLLPMCLAFLGSIMIGIAAHGRQKPVETSIEPEPAKAPPRGKEPAPAPTVIGPKLTVIQGGIVSTLTDLLEKAPRARVAIDDLYRAYAARMKPEDRLEPVKFAEEVAKFCRKIRIKTSEIDGNAYLLGVRLAANMSQMATI
jgi:hypothetical protein